MGACVNTCRLQEQSTCRLQEQYITPTGAVLCNDSFSLEYLCLCHSKDTDKGTHAGTVSLWTGHIHHGQIRTWMKWSLSASGVLTCLPR